MATDDKYIAYRFRIYPDKEQRIYFAKAFGCKRKYWNVCLEESKNNLTNNNVAKFSSPAKVKADFPYMKEIDSLVFCNAQLDLQKAWKNHFKQSDKFGEPNFKKKRDGYASFTTNNQNGTIKLSDKYLSIPKLKSKIKIKKHREFEGKIKSVTITREPSGKYYASILVEVDEFLQGKTTSNAIGLDVGINKLITDSNGKVYDNIKTTKKYEKKKAREDRKLSRKKFGSNNYEKQRLKKAKVDEKIRNIRKDYIHKLTSKIVEENQTIVMEDLKVKNMMKNPHLSKAIADCSWSEIARQLEYKAARQNKEFTKIDTFYPSSQICSNCGFRNHEVKKLSIRQWNCPCCNTHHDRDVNAAKNILNKGLENLKKTS